MSEKSREFSEGQPELSLDKRLQESAKDCVSAISNMYEISKKLFGENYLCSSSESAVGQQYFHFSSSLSQEEFDLLSDPVSSMCIPAEYKTKEVKIFDGEMRDLVLEMIDDFEEKTALAKKITEKLKSYRPVNFYEQRYNMRVVDGVLEMAE
ncbi:hypothetical protein CSB37_02455 [bacterium DOLZORAL124_38_8]|nr:MAG: hypothetical protein CSB37_02455 [bacterium DOLZORAL124_38_8]